MIKAIIATGIFAALAAIVFKKGDFGAIPTKSDRMEYKKRCPHHAGRRFTYPDKWEENVLSEDKRVSSKGTSPADKLPICVAKTQYSFSDDPSKLGAPTGFKITVPVFMVGASSFET